jgi:hypothetical protein
MAAATRSDFVMAASLALRQAVEAEGGVDVLQLARADESPVKIAVKRMPSAMATQ